MNLQPINLQEKLDTFSDYWNPRIIGELNEQHVKIAKFKDEFVMHQHENEDEMFLVLNGTLRMQLDDKTIEIQAGEFVIVPKRPTTNLLLLGK